MQKYLSAYSIALLQGIVANAADHPFVGEHANASAVQNENGSVSMRLRAKQSSYDRNRVFISEEDVVEPEKGFLTYINELLLGVAEPDQEKSAS